MRFRDQNIRYFSTLDGIKVPNVMRVVAWMLVFAITCSVTFLIVTPWVQNASGPGTVTALNPDDRLQPINALVSGRINKWFVRDGSAVKMGDPIVEIVDNDPNLIDRLDSEKAQLVASRDAAKSALETAKIDLNRTYQLFNEGLAARRDYEQAQIRIENLRSQLAEANAAINRIEVSISRQSVQIVKAPRDGVILQVNAGDTATFVSTGQRIATFVPTGVPRAVELYVDGRDVALVRPGSPVRLEFEGWPAFQFSGWPEMAIGTFGGRVAAVDLSAGLDGRFRVLVVEGETAEEKWPDERFVRLGSAARGWVLFDTVPAGYELWRQLNNFPPQFNVGPSDLGSETAQTGSASLSAGR